MFRDRGESAEVLYVIRAQHGDDPARWRTERADDDRAVAGCKAGSDRQRPYSGAVQERHPGQVQDKPLDPVIEDPCRMLQELASRQEVERAAQDECADRGCSRQLGREGREPGHVVLPEADPGLYL